MRAQVVENGHQIIPCIHIAAGPSYPKEEWKLHLRALIENEQFLTFLAIHASNADTDHHNVLE